MDYLLVFKIAEQYMAFVLNGVERVIPAVAITPFSDSKDLIEGCINLHGKIIPVVNCRKLFGLPPKNIELKDQMIICKMEEGMIALWVDQVQEVIQTDPENIVAATEVSTDVRYFSQIMKTKNKLIFIFDLHEMVLKNRILASSKDYITTK